MPPPPLPIKTPRPDISIGLKRTALIAALSSQNLNSRKAMGFLESLKQSVILREEGGLTEPMLISAPASRGVDLVFPFAVVEGKAYMTGKQFAEAENQAAVSGASGLKIQLCLDDLVKRSKAGPDIPTTPSKSPTPLFFSICTEGPYHELFAPLHPH
jgi:hypothetical protein